MVGWHHQFNGHEFEQTLGDSEGQGSLVCYSPWGHKESDRAEWLNNNNDPAVRLVDIYPEKTIIQRDMCTSVFTATLFTGHSVL